MFKNPDLAGSFRLIAEHGRAGFYEGKTAEAILAISREKGGTMTAADLKEYQPEWVEPISTTYRGWTVSELPPNTQGIAALMMLNLMEPFPLGEYGFHSTKALHVMIEAKKLAYADMLRYVADPKFSKAPVAAMLSKEHAKARAKLIDPAKAACSVEPSVFDGLTNSPGGDTIYLSVDRQGRQHRLADPEPLRQLRQRPGRAGHRHHAAQPRRAVHPRREATRTRSRRASGRCTPSFRRSCRRAT